MHTTRFLALGLSLCRGLHRVHLEVEVEVDLNVGSRMCAEGEVLVLSMAVKDAEAQCEA